MSQLESFITAKFRPEITGGRLDSNHQTRFIFQQADGIKLPELEVNAVAFGPKQDRVLLSLEHTIDPKDNVLIFYYEDIHKRWSYCRTNQENYFLFKKNEEEQYRINAKCLYIRGCQVFMDDPAWQILGEFYNFIDTWDGKVMCAPKTQNNNESKLYQLSQSIKQACNQKKSISIGKSYVIKGEKNLSKLEADRSYIVKSLSGTRSIVVDENEYIQWDRSNLNYLPVLFQEKVKGNDLRIHTVNGKLYGKFSLSKDSVDYRYDNHFFELKDYHDFSDEMLEFCRELSLLEDNVLLGIDFIKTQEAYVVLEANPSPGWSAYYPCYGISNDDFVNDLLLELKHV